MSDRHRSLRHRVEGTTAAARILRPTHHDAPHPEHWHQDAWAFRDTVGELRFAETWLSNNLSRCRLVAAKRPEPGQEPEPLETGPAYELVARLAGGVGGQSDLLRQFGSYLLIPGVAYLVGEPKEHGEQYRVVNSEDLKLGHDEETNEPAYQLREGEQAGDWRSLPPGSLVTKVYRQHPRHRWEPDSPVRAAIPILRELVLLTQHVEATARSRLAGAGVQFLPAEADFPKGFDKFVDEFVRVMRTPIRDRASVAADVPFLVKIPGQYLQWIKDAFVTYATPFDDQAMALRDEGITRLGNALDMPRQILTGEDQNHWGRWQIEESGLKIHIEPSCEIICDGITTGFLDPGLSAVSENDEAARREMEQQLRLDEYPLSEFIVWYDTSDLRVRPDRSDVVQEAYDRYEADGEALRKELGLSEAQPWDVKAEETQQRIWLTHATSAQSPLAELALKKLGMVEEGDIPEPPPPPPPGAPPPPNGQQPPPEERSNRELPETQGEQPSPSQPQTVPARADAELEALAKPRMALVAACYTIVDRALEVAGKRVLAKMQRGNADGIRASGKCPAAKLHTCIDTDVVLPVAMQFVGAWDRLPEIADRLGETEQLEALTDTLDWYVHSLVTERRLHTWDGTADAIGVCPCEDAA